MTRDGDPAGQERISGVLVRECKNVLTRSGSLLEVFRTDWPELSIVPAQINWVTPYAHEDPDNWRLPHDSAELPCPL